MGWKVHTYKEDTDIEAPLEVFDKIRRRRKIGEDAQWADTWRRTTTVLELTSRIFLGLSTILAFAAGVFRITLLNFISGALGTVATSFQQFATFTKRKALERETEYGALIGSKYSVQGVDFKVKLTADTSAPKAAVDIPPTVVTAEAAPKAQVASEQQESIEDSTDAPAGPQIVRRRKQRAKLQRSRGSGSARSTSQDKEEQEESADSEWSRESRRRARRYSTKFDDQLLRRDGPHNLGEEIDASAFNGEKPVRGFCCATVAGYPKDEEVAVRSYDLMRKRLLIGQFAKEADRYSRASNVLETTAFVLAGIETVLVFAGGTFTNQILSFIAGGVGTVALVFGRFATFAFGEAASRDTLYNTTLQSALKKIKTDLKKIENFVKENTIGT